ncbi:hypothetical protein AYI70_g1699 [Smittium culicis]|uniref:Uncharacterized protein n=1 Tax=Smittium culicis TaxID=133412 RepID=A0A1R1YBM1_9FUNG|nr:hypothetical protein AYI70_g1699 [Smittium culicis]
MKNTSVDDATSKIISECTPKEIVGPDGTRYIQKIPNHYVMYIPNRYSKEMVVERLDLGNAARSKPGAPSSSKNPPAKRAKTKKQLRPAISEKPKASPRPTDIKPGPETHCHQAIGSIDTRCADPNTPVPATLNALPSATEQPRAASPAFCDYSLRGTYPASFQNTTAPFAKHTSYDQLLINNKDEKNNSNCSSSIAHLFNLNFLHPQPLQQSIQQQQQQHRPNEIIQQIPNTNTNIMQQLPISSAVTQNQSISIPQHLQYQLQIPKTKDCQQQQYLQQLHQQALYLYSSM